MAGALIIKCSRSSAPTEHDTSQPLEQIEIDDRVVDTSDRDKSGLPEPLTQVSHHAQYLTPESSNVSTLDRTNPLPSPQPR